MGIASKLKRLRSRLGANGPGITIAVIALVFALAGGAFAASGGLTSKQKKQVTAIAKKEAGKVKSTPGPAGPQGSPGSPGLKGDKGDRGLQGEPGLNGQPGESAVISSIPKGEEACEEQGGVEVRLESLEEGEGEAVCNGKEGSPWTVGGTLPSGSTETGSFAVSVTTANTAENPALGSLSFSIPMPTGLTEPEVHFSTEPNFSDFDEGGPEEIGCKASVANPAGPINEDPTTANPPGQLCVYVGPGTGNMHNAHFEGIFPLSYQAGGEKGVRRAGGNIAFSTEGGGAGFATGSFAVTAP